MSFVFASTAAEVLSSCIFIFVKHPFDVGDRVDIGGEPLVVERISLLFTTFRKVKDHRNTQVPNTILNTNWIDNISRSKAMREQLLMYISFDTTLEDIQLLKNEIQKFVLDKENSRDFQADVDVEVTGIAEMNKMELKVEIKHKVGDPYLTQEL
jgi:small-conductance mechanosensitive channel